MELAALLKVIEIWDTCVPVVVKGVSVLPVCRFPDSVIPHSFGQKTLLPSPQDAFIVVYFPSISTQLLG